MLQWLGNLGWKSEKTNMPCCYFLRLCITLCICVCVRLCVCDQSYQLNPSVYFSDNLYLRTGKLFSLSFPLILSVSLPQLTKVASAESSLCFFISATSSSQSATVTLHLQKVLSKLCDANVEDCDLSAQIVRSGSVAFQSNIAIIPPLFSVLGASRKKMNQYLCKTANSIYQ